MSMSNLARLVKEITSTSILTLGRVKIDTPDVLGIELTLRDFDFVEYVDSREQKTVNYPVVVFDELPESYYCGGKALADICTAIEANGLHDELRTNGLRVMLGSTKTKANQPFVTVTVIE